MSRGDEHALWIWVEEFDEWRVLERWRSYQDNIGALNHYRNQIHAGRLTIVELSKKAEPPSLMSTHPLYGRF